MTQAKLALVGIHRLALKPVSAVFIAAELLDITTTFVGLALHPQMWEANPLAGLLGGMVPAAIFKLLVTLVVVTVIEKVGTWPKLIWLVPLLASVPVVWNLLSISAEFISAVSASNMVLSILGAA